MSKLQETSKE